jgi:lipid-binding SYLF domain-containing protein
MPHNICKRTAYIFGILVFLLLSASETPAPTSDQNLKARAGIVSQLSASVLNKLVDNNGGIPRNILDQAKAIAVFPETRETPLLFFISRVRAKGVVSSRVFNGWTTPAFFDVQHTKLKFSLSLTSSNHVLLLMSDKAIERLKANTLHLGDDVSISPGPQFHRERSDYSVIPDADVLYYSDTFSGASSQGLIPFFPLKNAALKPDDKTNIALYGLTAKQINTKGYIIKATDASSLVNEFLDILNHSYTESTKPENIDVPITWGGQEKLEATVCKKDPLNECKPKKVDNKIVPESACEVITTRPPEKTVSLSPSGHFYICSGKGVTDFYKDIDCSLSGCKIYCP